MRKNREPKRSPLAFFRAVCLTFTLFVSCAPASDRQARPPSPSAEAPIPAHYAFTVAGSGSNIPLTQRLLDEYAMKTKIGVRIPPSIGTSGAVKAVREGKLNLGLTSRPLKDSEKAAGLKQRPYSRIGIVLAAHGDVVDENISAAELVEVYKGTKKTWSNGKPIIVLARESGDSSNAVLELRVPGFKEVLADALGKKRWDIFYTDQDENEAIRTTMHALGLTDTAALAALGAGVKALRYDGVEPSLGNIESGAYPLWKDLFFIFKDPVPEAAEKFMDFVGSAEGAALLRKNGALPLGRD